MPKGVEHMKIVHSIASPSYVRIPMMPKGVEHKSASFLSARLSLGVRIPMMPKGVEHKSLEKEKPEIYLVRIPMMPKGVEHRGSLV